MIEIRPFRPEEQTSLWAVLEPTIRRGESYALPPDMPEFETVAYWTSSGRSVFVAVVEDGRLGGSYYLRANQQGAGAHVANCGYVVASDMGGRGIADCMCRHSLDEARRRGFKAMQFNFVVSTNTRAIGLWTKHGFDIVGRLPLAFDHPRLGLVDALVMYRLL